MLAVNMAVFKHLMFLCCVIVVTCEDRTKRQLIFTSDSFNPFRPFGQTGQVTTNHFNPFQAQNNNQAQQQGNFNADQFSNPFGNLFGSVFGFQNPTTRPTRKPTAANSQRPNSASLLSTVFSQFSNGSGYNIPLDVTGNQQLQETRFLNLGFDRPNEVFQQCLTPNNEPGNCRHALHCLIPQLFNIFIGIQYICPIPGGFLGVCCPHSVQPVKPKPNNPTVPIVKPVEPVYSGEGCGEHVSFNTRIVGGREADPKEWPWMAALLRNTDDQYCGGALISPQHVLTASHCLVNFQASGVRVRLGEYNFESSSQDAVDLAVTKIIMHPNYHKATYENDIAVLKLEREVPFSEAIRPVCLASDDSDYTGQIATVTGWGTISYGGPTSPKLLEVSLPVWSNEDCQNAYPQNILSTQLCAGIRAGGKDSCQGDSGGPLVTRPPQSNTWKLIGVVSWGLRCAVPGHPGVYTRVSKYLEWIESAMAQ